MKKKEPKHIVYPKSPNIKKVLDICPFIVSILQNVNKFVWPFISLGDIRFLIFNPKHWNFQKNPVVEPKTNPHSKFKILSLSLYAVCIELVSNALLLKTLIFFSNNFPEVLFYHFLQQILLCSNVFYYFQFQKFWRVLYCEYEAPLI